MSGMRCSASDQLFSQQIVEETRQGLSSAGYGGVSYRSYRPGPCVCLIEERFFLVTVNLSCGHLLMDGSLVHKVPPNTSTVRVLQ